MKPVTKKTIGVVFEKGKRVALALAIVIVLNVFFNVGIQTFYDEPVYDDYCPNQPFAPYPDSPEMCVEQGGKWTGYAEPVPVREGETTVKSTGYCDLTYECYPQYETARGVYNRNVFLILTVLGALMLIVSLYVNISTPVLSGLAYGGVISILIGTMRYWSDMDEYLRFIVTGIMLAVLIAVGVKKFRD